MAKKRKIPKTAEDLINEIETAPSPFTIMAASMNGSCLNYSYEERLDKMTENLVNVKSQQAYHEDLKAAFAMLDKHLALICEEISASEVSDIDEPVLGPNDPLFAFKVSAIRLSGNAEAGSVILIGVKTLSTHGLVKLETPAIKWDSDYVHINELRLAVDKLTGEVLAYKGGKSAPPAQTSLDFPDAEEELS